MAVKFKDYYKTLGVERSATQEDIKQAFRKLARVHHPDVAKNKAAGEAKFKEVNEAYEVLGDSEKRQRYDELGANWQDAGGGQDGQETYGRGRASWSRREPGFEFGGTGFSDFFESFFGSRREGFGAYREPAQPEGDFVQPGRDVEADIMVTLEEALRGSLRKVTLRRTGGAGGGGGQTGDLYLRVRLARHPDFSIRGADLYFDLDLAPWEAVLGVQAKVPALDGKTMLRVPPGTAAGSQLRLRGLGLPCEDGSRGDLYAVARIQVPASASAEERALWEKLARASAFRPRKMS